MFDWTKIGGGITQQPLLVNLKIPAKVTGATGNNIGDIRVIQLPPSCRDEKVPGGRKCCLLQVGYDSFAVNQYTAYRINLLQLHRARIDTFRSVWINNTPQAAVVAIYCEGTEFTIYPLKDSMGLWPLFCLPGDSLWIVVQNTQAISPTPLQVYLFNFVDTNFVTSLASVGGTSLQLETNNVPNVVQTLLDLKSGANITVSDNGDGSVTIAAINQWLGPVIVLAYKISLTANQPSTHIYTAQTDGLFRLNINTYISVAGASGTAYLAITGPAGYIEGNSMSFACDISHYNTCEDGTVYLTSGSSINYFVQNLTSGTTVEIYIVIEQLA